MKIVVDSAIPFIKDRFPADVDVKYLPGREINAQSVKDADALIVRTRTRCDEGLLKNSRVKLIATATIGTDHIDLPWCESNDIVVKSSPGCNAPGVAQYVLASLIKSGFEPLKDTLGIVGYGHVGRIVADWAHKMGIKTIINDTPRKDQGLKDIEYRSLDEVLKESDAVTVHVPFTMEGSYPTYQLIGKKELDFLRPGAILVNSSRGGVVDEKSLKISIDRNRVKAVVDVWENEPDIDFELLKKVSIATPHIAGYSAEGKKRATRMVLEAVKDVLGVQTDITGLECDPLEGLEITQDLVVNSYNPEKDSDKLKENPERFEKLRNEYQYRHEPLFT